MSYDLSIFFPHHEFPVRSWHELLESFREDDCNVIFVEEKPLDADALRECSIVVDQSVVSIAVGEGPNRAILALGYAGWSPGQLESEIQANGWLNCPPDMDLIFDLDVDAKYIRALAKLGIDPSHLVSDAGHA